MRMSKKKLVPLCAAVAIILLVAAFLLFSVASCRMMIPDPPLPDIPDTSILGGHVYVVWPRTRTVGGVLWDSLAAMPTNMIHSNEISLSSDGQRVQMGTSPSYSGFTEHDPVTEPAYQILKDFLLMPGVEESDTITLDTKGKITYLCKYGPQSSPNVYAALYDMEVVIGYNHGTTLGTGELDPRFFARNVVLAGWPDTEIGAVDNNINKTIKVSGGRLSKGSKLLLHGYAYMAGGVGDDNVPYYIYSSTPNYNPAPTVCDIYKYTY
jgi:hypothetical protein